MKGSIKDNFFLIVKRRVIIIFAVAVLLYTLTGFFLVPFLIGHYLPGMLSERFQSKVTLEKVTFNPYSLAMEARDFWIHEPSGDLLAGFDRLHVNFQLSSLFRWALTFKDVILDGPSLIIVVDPEGNLNLERLAGSGSAEEVEQVMDEEPQRPKRLVLYNVEINEARIDVADMRQSEPARVSFYPLTVHFADISTLPDREGVYSLTATGGNGELFDWNGYLTLHPFHSEGELAFRDIPLETPWSFYRSMVNILPPRGQISLEARYLVDLGKETTIAILDDLRVEVAGLGLQLDDAQAPFLSLPLAKLDVKRVDVTGRRIDDLSLAIPGGALDVISDEEGLFNLQRIVRTGNGNNPAAVPSGPEEAPGDPWHVDISRVALEGISLNLTDETLSPARVFSTAAVNLDFRADIVTALPQSSLRLHDIGLAIEQIALGYADAKRPALQVGALEARGGSFDLAARSAFLSRLELNNGIVDVIRDGEERLNLVSLFDVAGFSGQDAQQESSSEDSEPWSFFLETFEMANFTTHVTDETVQPGMTLVDLESIALTFSQFDGASAFPFEASLRVNQGGVATVSGSMDPSTGAVESVIAVENLALPVIQPYLAQAADLTMKSGLLSTGGSFDLEESGAIAYRGQVDITSLEIIENRTQDIMLGWIRLRTPEMRLSLNPHGLAMDTLNIGGLQGKLIIADDGTVNVVEAFRDEEESSSEPGEKQPATEKPGEPFPVTIGRITLDNGAMHFADFSLRPQFETRIHELKGFITGVSSSPGTRSEVSLAGRVDRYGSNKIEGKINFFDPKEFTNISMMFKNLEMSSMTPYSGKFAGRAIDSGRLSLDLKYHIEESRLVSHNQVVIDSLVLGERVESPDAINLPLGLAIAVLRDDKGVINVEIPVTGSLDDPEFRYGHVVWQAVVTLLRRIVTSPFRALGALLGAEDETFNEVLFEPGSIVILPTEEEKLDLLLKALHQRPRLKLIVTGRYDGDADGWVLRDHQLRRAVTEALGRDFDPGEDPGPIDMSSADSQSVLAELFVERYGEEEYEQVLADLMPPDENGDPEDREVEETTPEEVARKLFTILLERERVDLEVLKALAVERAEAVVAHLTESDEKIETDRIATGSPEQIEEGERLTVTLDLDAIEDES